MIFLLNIIDLSMQRRSNHVVRLYKAIDGQGQSIAKVLAGMFAVITM